MNSPETNQETQKSEEVQDIIDRMPLGWTFRVTLVVIILIAVLFILSSYIQYPDTIRGEISITAQKAPVRLVSVTSARIHLLTNNRQLVKRGTVIAYLESGANYEHIIRIEKILRKNISEQSELELPQDLILGKLSSIYNNFVLAYEQYDKLRRTKIYANMKQSLQLQISANQKLSQNMKNNIDIGKEVLSHSMKRYLSDSILYTIGALSQKDLEDDQAQVLNQQQSRIELHISKLGKDAEIQQNLTDLAKVSINESEEITKAYHEMAAQYNQLISAIKEWKEQYLFISPIDGELEFLGFWRNNSFITNSQEIFSISPSQNQLFGEVKIPTAGAGKVRKGQTVNIKLNDYPYNEYGLIKGQVMSISKISERESSEKGQIETYLIIVSFPSDMMTNYHKILKVNFESKGSAEIITSSKRLIMRLFDNLKAKEEK